ncbi:hypothetical protein BGLA2_1670006 [Burkholderia gladioli]|nr:hypothetical protein BGLA2_1670006 [Burkholderia gladioli]
MCIDGLGPIVVSQKSGTHINVSMFTSGSVDVCRRAASLAAAGGVHPGMPARAGAARGPAGPARMRADRWKCTRRRNLA